MRFLKLALITAAATVAFGFSPVTQHADAQISFGIGIGVAPVCPYGYYGYAPYHCAPRGFYGPEWFNGGRFIGAGPYYHGREGFYGHVDNRYDEHHGYHGPYPGHDEHYHSYGSHDFHGNDTHDIHGNHYDAHSSTDHHDDHH
jgi:hypothetical protein